MPTFTYIGVSPTGAAIEGVVEAFDEIEAMEKARESCHIVQKITAVREKRGLPSIKLTEPRVKPKNLAILCSQFSIILQAGLSVARAVDLVADQTADKYLGKVLLDTAADVSAGHGLADSLESKGRELPRVFIETVRAGEESGNLPQSFGRLQSYYDKRSKITAKVASALTYPVFVLTIAVAVVAIMMIMVVPAISNMVSSLGSDMPGITRFLINVSTWFSANFLWVALVIAVLAIGLRLYGKTERGKTFYAQMQMKTPFLGVIVAYSGAAQFANTMGTLIASGLSTANAVKTTARVMSNYILSRDVGRMEAGLQEGKSLGECMQEGSHFPRTLVEMCAVGEQTGELENTLQTIGEFYDSETQRVTDRALSLMEPALLVLMALFAGFIVIALYLPMFTMYANI